MEEDEITYIVSVFAPPRAQISVTGPLKMIAKLHLNGVACYVKVNKLNVNCSQKKNYFVLSSLQFDRNWFHPSIFVWLTRSVKPDYGIT